MNEEIYNKLENLRLKVELSEKQLEKKDFILQTIFDLSKEIGSLDNVHEVLEHLLMMVIGNFGALSGIVLLVDTNKNKIESIVNRGMEETSVDILSRAIESGYFMEMQKAANVHILGGQIDVQQQDEKKAHDLLTSLDINIWMPLEVDENLSGGIGVGEKLSSTPYTEDDWELLRALSNHGTLAIKNARFIEQIKNDQTVRINLVRYLSPQVVEQVIKKNVNVQLGGNKKIVTVLYSDIRDFTMITEDLPPDQLILILNEYFTEMAGIIFENNGSLDKYIGDAIVAVFGSLIQIGNHVQNAVQTAIQMMKSLQILNKKWEKKYNFTMEIGIGINSGEVFIGNIGSPERMEFTVIGDVINVASRFSDLARKGQILVTKEILSSLGSNTKYAELLPRNIKGKEKKLEVFEIV
jgi:class 3 adenylate cyclase